MVSESFDEFDTARTSRFRARWRDNHGSWLLVYTIIIGVIGAVVMAIVQPGRSDSANAAMDYGRNFGGSDDLDLPALSDPLAGSILPQDRVIVTDSDVANSPMTISDVAFMVTVSGAESDKGTIRIAIYGSADTFPDEQKAIFKDSVPIENGFGYCPVPIAELPAQIAVAAYHDQNGNGVMDRGLLSIPVEAYGFTNRARGMTGPPSFAAAALDTPPPGTEIYLPIRH